MQHWRLLRVSTEATLESSLDGKYRRKACASIAGARRARWTKVNGNKATDAKSVKRSRLITFPDCSFAYIALASFQGGDVTVGVFPEAQLQVHCGSPTRFRRS